MIGRRKKENVRLKVDGVDWGFESISFIKSVDAITMCDNATGNRMAILVFTDPDGNVIGHVVPVDHYRRVIEGLMDSVDAVTNSFTAD